MENKVFNYLNKHRATTEEFNFISMGEPFAGKFLLNDKQIEKFYKYYAVAANSDNTFNIAEKHKEYGPIIIDIDLKINIDKYIALHHYFSCLFYFD